MLIPNGVYAQNAHKQIMQEQLHTFYFEKEEPIKGCLWALRSIILSYSPQISESMKYGMPLFTYKGKMFCYLWTAKKTGHPYILMVDGKLLHHPALEQGNRAKMKILPIHAEMDIPIDTITAVFDMAVGLYGN